jgi:hypothetical protein
MGGACCTLRRRMKTGLWWGSLQDKGLNGTPRRRWENNIEVYLK